MPTVQLQRFEAVLQRMIARVVARANLTDLNDSSVVKHIIAAAAREIDDANFQLTRLSDVFSIDRAAGSDLDARALDIQPATLTRMGAQRAVGFLVFSRGTNTGSTISIPIGSTAKTATGVLVKTTQTATITGTSAAQISGHGVGQDSNPVSAVALLPGSAGNIGANSATAFVGRPSGVDAVTNVTAFALGRDAETDDAFRARIKGFVSALARGTVDALKFASLGVTDAVSGRQVLYANVFEDPVNRGNVSIFIDDGTGTAAQFVNVTNENVTLNLLGPPVNSAVGGEQFLFLQHHPISLESAFTLLSSSRGTLSLGVDYTINPASGLIYFITPLAAAEVITANYTYFSGLIADVQEVIDGNPNDRVDFPGIRAAGILVRVLTPVVRSIAVSATLTIASGNDVTTMQNNVTTAITNYINNLGIGANVVRSELIAVIMNVPGMVDVNVTIPLGNIVINYNEIARTSGGNILLS